MIMQGLERGDNTRRYGKSSEHQQRPVMPFHSVAHNLDPATFRPPKTNPQLVDKATQNTEKNQVRNPEAIGRMENKKQIRVIQLLHSSQIVFPKAKQCVRRDAFPVGQPFMSSGKITACPPSYNQTPMPSPRARFRTPGNSYARRDGTILHRIIVLC